MLKDEFSFQSCTEAVANTGRFAVASPTCTHAENGNWKAVKRL